MLEHFTGQVIYVPFFIWTFFGAEYTVNFIITYSFRMEFIMVSHIQPLYTLKKTAEQRLGRTSMGRLLQKKTGKQCCPGFIFKIKGNVLQLALEKTYG